MSQQYPNDILAAMSADAIPEAEAGLWTIKKINSPLLTDLYRAKHKTDLPYRDYTFLHHLTLETLHQGLGECVMEDTPKELRTHLDFAMAAKGKVLISGLGLGCVARGVLVNQDVESVTIVERDQHIIDMVMPHMPNDPRLNIIHDCAIRYSEFKEHYDYAWHDIWSNPDKDEDQLPFLHVKIIGNLLDAVKKQGAWGLPKYLRRKLVKESWWYAS